MTRYTVAMLPIKAGYSTTYIQYNDMFSTLNKDTMYFTWADAIAKRDEMRNEPGLSEAGIESIVVTTL